MIGHVVRTGWMNIRRDKAALMLSFIVPIVFFSIFASVFGGRKSGTPTISIAVVDEDQTAASQRLVAALRAEKTLKVDPKSYDAKSAEELVRTGKTPVALVIPKGFSAMSVSFGPDPGAGPRFRVYADTSDPIASDVAQGMLQKTIMTALPDFMMKSGVETMERYGGPLTPQQRMMLDLQTERMKQPGGGAGGGSLIPIDVTDVLGKSKRNPMIAFYAAGIGVMFLLFTASNAGGSMLEEVESGTLDRILTTRVTMTTLLGGKLVYLWTLGMVQIIVMFVWGSLAFGLELQRHLAGFAIMASATALATAAFGLLIASVARTRQQLGAISTLIVLSISAIGGSMFPRFLMPESFQRAGLVLFNAWAIEGFTRVFWRDEPLASLVGPVAFLVVSAIVFFAIARQLTKRWELV
jgi:ABC-2 type transport system permease protein